MNRNKYLLIIPLLLLSACKPESQTAKYERLFSECVELEQRVSVDVGADPYDPDNAESIRGRCVNDAYQKVKGESDSGE